MHYENFGLWSSDAYAKKQPPKENKGGNQGCTVYGNCGHCSNPGRRTEPQTENQACDIRNERQREERFEDEGDLSPRQIQILKDPYVKEHPKYRGDASDSNGGGVLHAAPMSNRYVPGMLFNGASDVISGVQPA